MDSDTILTGMIVGAVILGVIYGFVEEFRRPSQGTENEQFQDGLEDHAAGQTPRWWWSRPKRRGWMDARRAGSC